MAKESDHSDNWGGARPGAGRPTRKKVPSTEQIGFKITKGELELVKEFSQKGESRHQAARRILLEALRKMKGDDGGEEKKDPPPFIP